MKADIVVGVERGCVLSALVGTCTYPPEGHQRTHPTCDGQRIEAIITSTTTRDGELPVGSHHIPPNPSLHLNLNHIATPDPPLLATLSRIKAMNHHLAC